MAQEREKDIQQLKNRFRDLAERSYSQGIFTFTGFLGLSEQELFWQQEKDLRYAGYALDGGYRDADRVVIRFGSETELGYVTPFPIACIHISPLMQKFADDLSHRDFLGALMNLGIDRSTLGDIRVGDREAYLFCLTSVADFVCENLDKVKHTQVRSLRADAVLARICDLSREGSLELFRAGRVYVNGRLCENNSRLLKEGETVNARGFGKFRLINEPRETRKGRLAVDAAVYR